MKIEFKIGKLHVSNNISVRILIACFLVGILLGAFLAAKEDHNDSIPPYLLFLCFLPTLAVFIRKSKNKSNEDKN